MKYKLVTRNFEQFLKICKLDNRKLLSGGIGGCFEVKYISNFCILFELIQVFVSSLYPSYENILFVYS